MLYCIQAQSYTDWELILVDDGSSDETSQICDQACCNDSRISCIHQENAGVSAARNRGISIAKGDYITFLDADDKIPQNYLFVLLECCKKGDIAVCDTIVVQDGKEINRFTHEDAVLTQTEALNLLLSRKKINSGPYSKMFRRDIISDVCFPPLCVYEDILFVQEAISRANSVIVTDETAYLYIQNSSGAMSGMMKNPSLDIIIASDKLLYFIESNPQLTSECFYTTISHVFQYVVPLAKNNGFKNCDFLFKARALYKKYMWSILACKAVPWKEKVVFWLFAHGWVYYNKEFKFIREKLQ